MRIGSKAGDRPDITAQTGQRRVTTARRGVPRSENQRLTEMRIEIGRDAGTSIVRICGVSLCKARD